MFAFRNHNKHSKLSVATKNERNQNENLVKTRIKHKKHGFS